MCLAKSSAKTDESGVLVLERNRTGRSRSRSRTRSRTKLPLAERASTLPRALRSCLLPPKRLRGWISESRQPGEIHPFNPRAELMGSARQKVKPRQEAASERSRRVARDIDGQTERSNGAFGKNDIEGKAAMVAASELGSERVSNGRAHMSQSGDERVSNPRSKIRKKIKKILTCSFAPD